MYHKMSKHYISHYKSPNIIKQPTVIIPTPTSPKRPKIDNSPQMKQSPENVDISFLDDFNIDEIVSCLQKSDNMHNNTENEVKETNISESDIKLDDISNIKMSEKPTIRISKTTKAKEGSKLAVTKCIKETDNKKYENRDNTPIEEEESMNIDTKLVTLKGDLNSTLSFKFIEYSATELNSSDCTLNKDLENCITIKVNVDLIANDKLKTKCVTQANDNLIRVETENIEMRSSNVCSLNNKLCELHTERDNFKTELQSDFEAKKASAIKSTVQNGDDILVSPILEKYRLKFLYMQYFLQSIMHHGAHSKIFKCQNSAGEECAVKMLNLVKRRKNMRGVQMIKMLRQIQSDIPKENLFCVFLRGCFEMNKHWCFVMEFYPKNLREVINDSSKLLNINIVQNLARQLVSAVMLLRNNNIIHSDINPSHILINCSNDKLKLCGFDKAYYNEHAIISQCTGTLSYRSPEAILGYSSGFSIDVWSTGLVLHEMVTGRKLFLGSRNVDILYQQMSILGNMSPEMIINSRFGAQYFIRDNFTQTFGFVKKGEKNICNFNKSNKIHTTVNGAYFEHWASLRTENERKYDTQKINSFVNLLQKIIVLHPKRRLTIEFVYANPFIYNIHD